MEESLLLSISQLLNESGKENKTLSIKGPVGGGSVNLCYRLTDGTTDFFLKVNDAQRYPQMFLTEARGLSEMNQAGVIRVPQVLSEGEADHWQYLLLEWISPGADNDNSQASLGARLAALHRVSSDSFGLHFDNYMGSLPQSNRLHASWVDFFREERIKPQLKLAKIKNLLDKDLLLKFDRLFNRLEKLAPTEKPALIHGDLWSGNYIISREGHPVLIDPAIVFGHREVDMAMTTVFGGFRPSFYEAYQEVYPLSEGWKERLDLWNIYPLLIHLNLFGPAYLHDLVRAVTRYL